MLGILNANPVRLLAWWRMYTISYLEMVASLYSSTSTCQVHSSPHTYNSNVNSAWSLGMHDVLFPLLDMTLYMYYWYLQYQPSFD